ncbi:MAG: 6-phosphogluconolactonase, partial [Myxococcaceae bacterium]|nr:6-phosphogluconolactonase [Myxococcaceae bacterium]
MQLNSLFVNLGGEILSKILFGMLMASSMTMAACASEDARTADLGEISEALEGSAAVRSPVVVYVGSHDSGDPSTATGQIAVYALDPTTGALTWTSAIARDDQNLLDHPTFLAFDRAHSRLFAVSENYFDPTPFQSAVSAFAVDRQSGALHFVNSRATGYSFSPFEFTLGAVHLTLDPTASHLLVAIFDNGGGGGAVQTYPIDGSGSLGEKSQEVTVGAEPHELVFAPDSNSLLVPEKGADRIESFSYDGATGALTLRSDAAVTTQVGAGPRHLAFSGDARFAYLVSESAATLSVYRVANHQLVTPALQTLTTVPADVAHFDRARAAEVAIDAHGLVYVSTRFDALQTDGTYLPLEGYITSYRPHGPDGSLSPVQATRVGKEPRHFSIDPTSRFLVVANQESNSVV